MQLLIVVHSEFELWNAPKWFGERLSRVFPQIEVTQRERYEGIEERLRDAEIIFSSSLQPEQFAIARNLRWMHAPSAGVHDLLFPELVKSEVKLTNSREVHGPVVAEHVMALIFALAKKIPQAVRLQQKCVWGKGEMWNQRIRPREIAGATLGLMGVGSIGGRIAKLASALGMRVIAVREHVEKGRPEGVEAVFSPAQIGEMLKQSDFVVLAAPLVSTTERVMNEDRLAGMKSEAYLINVGRGAQVDEAALIAALRSHRIAGAALDVFEQEPLPPDSPLWGLEDLLITPHTAGLTEKLWDRHYELFATNLRRYLAGEPLSFLVDKQIGY